MQFETFAEDVFHRYARRWKPRTLVVNRSYLRNEAAAERIGAAVAARLDAAA